MGSILRQEAVRVVHEKQSSRLIPTITVRVKILSVQRKIRSHGDPNDENSAQPNDRSAAS